MKLSVSALRLLGWCLLPWVSLGLVLLLLTSPLNTFFFLFFFFLSNRARMLHWG